MNSPPAPIAVDLVLGQVAPAGLVPVEATLSYDPTDPFAVSMRFHAGSDDVVWTFARSLLAGGISEPTGEGDVRVWPWIADETPIACIALDSPTGSALLHASIGTLVDFLADTYLLVPAGSESMLIDIDSLVEELLAA